jgi:hypothetical protein
VVDLALVLAVDCSSSIGDQEYVLQRAGYAAAFNDPRLVLTAAHPPAPVASAPAA